MYQKNLKLLYRSFEEQLNEEEQKQLAHALSRSAELADIQQQLEVMRADLANVPLQKAKPFLAERVLQKIVLSDEAVGLQERLWETLFYTFRRVAVVTALSVIVVFGFYLADQGETLSDNEVEIEDIMETDIYIAMGAN